MIPAKAVLRGNSSTVLLRRAVLSCPIIGRPVANPVAISWMATASEPFRNLRKGLKCKETDDNLSFVFPRYTKRGRLDLGPIGPRSALRVNLPLKSVGIDHHQIPIMQQRDHGRAANGTSVGAGAKAQEMPGEQRDRDLSCRPPIGALIGLLHGADEALRHRHGR
jgi:hypothetical protein